MECRTRTVCTRRCQGTRSRHLSALRFSEEKSWAKACEMVWYAHNAGAQSRVTELMYKPRASTEFYAQHLERALGLDYDAESLCSVRMAAQDKYDQNRTVMDLPVHRSSS